MNDKESSSNKNHNIESENYSSFGQKIGKDQKNKDVDNPRENLSAVTNKDRLAEEE